MKKIILLLACSLLLIGCDSARPKLEPHADAEAPPIMEAPQEQDPEQQQDEANEHNTAMVRAEAGVGARGSSMTPPAANNPVGRIVSAPVYSLFRTEQRLVFDMQITPALNLFRAEHGRLPNSHNEFMERIIRPNNIQLPALRPSEEYIYDPQRGELMVRRPG